MKITAHRSQLLSMLVFIAQDPAREHLLEESIPIARLKEVSVSLGTEPERIKKIEGHAHLIGRVEPLPRELFISANARADSAASSQAW